VPSRTTDPRDNLLVASKRVEEAEAELAQARRELQRALVFAYSQGGMSFAEIGRELNISRQRVTEIYRRILKGE
jgi:DNA-directed RNA polymerase specialized sigma24 family protein